MIKRGCVVTNWKKRWFILKGDYLYYYSSLKSTGHFKGVILVKDCSIGDLGTYEGKQHVFVLIPR